MKVYLASRYSRLPEMQAVREDLRVAGHEVTSRWVNGEHQASDNDAPLLLTAKFATEDQEDLEAADCVISFTEAPRTGPTRGGRHVEFGMAIALGKRLIVVGHRENVFHALPDVEFFPSWAQAYRSIA
jgi:nucleoside 2-deoxyribosyltransferase